MEPTTEEKSREVGQSNMDETATTYAILPCPDQDTTPDQGSKLRQYAAATAATMGAFAAGTTLAWSSPAVPLLGASMGLTTEEGSWTGSLLSLGALFGALPSGLLAQSRGRKQAVASLALPFILSWVLLLTTHSVAWVYVARFLAGLGLGGVCVSIPIYVAEIAEDSVRGSLGALLQVMFNVGILFSYVMGATGSYSVLNGTCLLVPVVFFGSFVWMPETPFFLLSKGRTSEAHRALQWLRGPLCNVQYELQLLETATLEDLRQRASLRSVLANRATIRALAISLGLVAFQQLSGICVVFFYTQAIFEVSGSSLSPSMSAMIVGVVMLLMSFVTTMLVDRAGRKLLLFVSSVVMGLALVLLGLFFLLQERLKLDVGVISWLPLASVIIYIVMYCLGLGPLPWTVMAEVLPPNVKGVAGSFVSSFCWLLSFCVTKSYATLLEWIGPDFTFWLFAVYCGLSALFIVFVVPETKGKSFQQIQEVLSSKSRIPRAL